MKIPLDSLRELERERGISFETLIEAIEKSLASAYLRVTNADETRGSRSTIDTESGDVTVYAQDVEIDPETEEVTVLREWEDTPADFGRIAAQTAKQVILQRLREAERDMTFGILGPRGRHRYWNRPAAGPQVHDPRSRQDRGPHAAVRADPTRALRARHAP